MANTGTVAATPGSCPGGPRSALTEHQLSCSPLPARPPQNRGEGELLLVTLGGGDISGGCTTGYLRG